MGPTEAPEMCWGEVEAAAAMVRFIWSELFWKRPMMDLAFGIKYLMRRRHLFLHEDGLNKSVQGYAHCGMVAAARWIAKWATPYFLRAFIKYPDYSIKIVGNSLGGGTAALLTYILREREEFSSSTCVSFAPAACMTWKIAESGKDFITTLINGTDQVPSYSITSINYLRSEVSSSSWLNDLWARVQHSRFFSVVNCFRSPVGTNVESKTSATVEEDVVAGLHPIPTKTQVPTECTKVASLEEEDTPDNCTISRKGTFSLVVERVDTGVDFGCSSSSNCRDRQGEGPIVYRVTAIPTANKKTVGETTEEGNAGQSVSSDDLEMPRLYTPRENHAYDCFT